MDIDFENPFIILKRKEDIDFKIFEGSIKYIDSINDININNDKNNTNEDIYDSISAIPYANIREKDGFVSNSELNLKIASLKIEKSYEKSYDEILHMLPSGEIELEDNIKSLYSQDEYANIVKNIVENEIGQGEGANFLIANEKSCDIKNFNVNKALSIFKNLITNEYGSYWSFIFFDGSGFLIGATPEAHIVVKNNRVKMHPISGTYRKPKGKLNLKSFKKEFLDFLNDKKEINELFMCVDEELKMMASFCNQGGMIIGPLLKEMSALIHTEYILTGKTDKDVLTLLKESMFAATVMGSPIQNASKIIKKYEQKDRGFYASTLALIGRDENSQIFLDSPILIRTLEIDMNGKLTAKVGATIVRNSNPQAEAKETEAKINAVFEAITNKHSFSKIRALPFVEENDEILESLQLRNQYLSKFWFFLQDNKMIIPYLQDKSIVIIHNEDDFCFMLSHMFNKLGLVSRVVYTNDYDIDSCKADFVVVGPGPGDPTNLNDKKMKKIYDITQNLLATKRKFISICLGHQVLSLILGFDIAKKSNPYQGVPVAIDLFDEEQIVGFYNTYEAKYKDINYDISYDKNSNGISAIRDYNRQFVSVQFHPESILTQNGFKIVKNLLEYISK